jgi:hypothetical protein
MPFSKAKRSESEFNAEYAKGAEYKHVAFIKKDDIGNGAYSFWLKSTTTLQSLLAPWNTVFLNH